MPSYSRDTAIAAGCSTLTTPCTYFLRSSRPHIVGLAGRLGDWPGTALHRQHRALGNAVVPQQAAAALRMLVDIAVAGNGDRAMLT